jgi:TusA-related sulfurtransferase
VKTRQAIENNPGQAISVLVETVVSKENVTRYAQSQGYKVEAKAAGDEFTLLLTPAS